MAHFEKGRRCAYGRSLAPLVKTRDFGMAPEGRNVEDSKLSRYRPVCRTFAKRARCAVCDVPLRPELPAPFPTSREYWVPGLSIGLRNRRRWRYCSG